MKLIKKVMVTGLIGTLILGNCMTAYASKSGAYLYGQELVGVDNEYQSYFAIVVGDTDGVIDKSELTFDEGCYSFQLAGLSYSMYGSEVGNQEKYGKPIPELKKINGVWATPEKLQTEIHGYDEENALEFLISKNIEDSAMTNILGIVKLPDNISVSDLSPNLKKYVIYAKDISKNPGSWKSDANGWWYDNGDGTYPVNQWKTIDGKSYYFGADGYMINDTTRLDNHTVGLEGAK